MNAVLLRLKARIYRGIGTEAVTVHTSILLCATDRMLTARPTEFHRRLFTYYFRRRARKMLAGVSARGHQVLSAWNLDCSPEHPLIIVANHSSWWDAVMPILLSLDLYKHDPYGVMEERQLVRYGFFRRVGMFSIDREKPRSARRSLDYAADLLRGRGRVLWLFPQGEIVPNDRRPIQCYPGTAHLIRLIGECSILPVAFRYELLDEERPNAFVSVGEIQKIPAGDERTTADLTELIATLLTGEADRLREDVVNGNLEMYEPILQGKRSINEGWDVVRGKKKRDDMG